MFFPSTTLNQNNLHPIFLLLCQRVIILTAYRFNKKTQCKISIITLPFSECWNWAFSTFNFINNTTNYYLLILEVSIFSLRTRTGQHFDWITFKKQHWAQKILSYTNEIFPLSTPLAPSFCLAESITDLFWSLSLQNTCSYWPQTAKNPSIHEKQCKLPYNLKVFNKIQRKHA